MKKFLSTITILMLCLSVFAQNKGLLPSKTPVQYEEEIRAAFHSGDWERGRVLLDEADPDYGTLSAFCELNGMYYYHFQQTDLARKHLLLALKDDESNTNAIRILIKLERDCGNYSTSIDHINALLEFAPYDRGLWRQKIEMYRLMGNSGEADRLLERIRTIYPDDELLRRDYDEHLQEIYQAQRKSGDNEGKLKSLEELVKIYPKDKSYHLALTNMYLTQGRKSDALAAAAYGVQATKGNIQLIRKYVGILVEDGLYSQAIAYIDACKTQFRGRDFSQLENEVRELWAESLKDSDPYSMNARRYAIAPSEEALQWLLKTAIRNGYWEDALMYNRDAIRLYGESEYWLAQAMMIHEHLGNSSEVIRLQEKIHALNPANQEVADAIASRSFRTACDLMEEEMYRDACTPLEEVMATAFDEELKSAAARRLATCRAILARKQELKSIGDAVDTAAVMMKRKEFREASRLLDTVLVKQPDHNEAMMMHADASQQLHAYDSAYLYLSKYKPLPQEVWDVRRRLNALKARSATNDISIDNQIMRRSSEDMLNHTMTAVYTHDWKRHRLNAYLGYAGRDSYAVYEEGEGGEDAVAVFMGGGTGLQLGMGYAYKWDKWSLGGRVLGSNMFFPRMHVALESDIELRNDWTMQAHASWRHIVNEAENYHLFSAGASASKTIGQITMTGALDLFMQNTGNMLYANGSFKIQYFPWEQERTNFNLSFGAGNAPEAAIIDQSLADAFSRLNTFVGMGTTVMVTGNVFLNASLSWYNMAAPANNQYRNYMFVNMGLSFKF